MRLSPFPKNAPDAVCVGGSSCGCCWRGLRIRITNLLLVDTVRQRHGLIVAIQHTDGPIRSKKLLFEHVGDVERVARHHWSRVAQAHRGAPAIPRRTASAYPTRCDGSRRSRCRAPRVLRVRVVHARGGGNGNRQRTDGHSTELRPSHSCATASSAFRGSNSTTAA